MCRFGETSRSSLSDRGPRVRWSPAAVPEREEEPVGMVEMLNSGVNTTDTHKQDFLSCLVCGANRIGDIFHQLSLVLNILETEQFCPVMSAV